MPERVNVLNVEDPRDNPHLLCVESESKGGSKLQARPRLRNNIGMCGVVVV